MIKYFIYINTSNEVQVHLTMDHIIWFILTLFNNGCK